MKPGHTSHEFESELRELRGHLLAMSARCERALVEAVTAFVDRDQPKADAVRALDERIDRDEMDIDELALRILALRQPVAYDLRFLTTTLKFVTDLERIGDEAVNIAERVSEVVTARELPPHGEIQAMAQHAQSMLRDALDAFVDGDTAKAESVLGRDEAVDRMYGTVLRNAFEWMRGHPDAIPCGQAVASVAKYIERVADHATNLAEHVVFMVRGDDVRHRGMRGKGGPDSSTTQKEKS